MNPCRTQGCNVCEFKSPLGHKPLPHGVQGCFSTDDPWPRLVGETQTELLVNLGLITSLGAREDSADTADRLDEAPDLVA